MSDRLHEPERADTATPEDALDLSPLTDLIGYHLRRAQARVFADFMAAMSEDSVTPGQFGVLALINANPGLSQSALARALGIERSTMVDVIDRLERQELVVRRKALQDRRSYALELTKKGRDQLSALLPKVRRHEARIAADLTGDDVRVLMALLGRIAADR